MVATPELIAALDDLLEPGRFNDGQVNGLQVEGRTEITRLATAVSANQQTIDAAIGWGADALVTHHGLLWGGIQSLQGVHRRRLATALGADLALISYHLPLDAHPHIGNNAALAEIAGCTTTQPGFPHRGAAIGLVGLRPEAVEAQTWTRHLEAALRHGCTVSTGPFQAWNFGPPEIQRIGFVSGGGAYDVQGAIEDGLDAFVTGEVRESVYHLCKEAGIHFIAGGHYLTERLGIIRLGEWCAERFGIEHRFIEAATEA